MISRCYFCGGTTEPRLVTAESWWGEDLTLVENTPAWVCEQCGEQYLDAETFGNLNRLREQGGMAARTRLVPVYDLATDLISNPGLPADVGV